MEKTPNHEKENKKKLSSFLPKALIEELNKNTVDKNHAQNNKPSFLLKEKDKNLQLNSNLISINGNHNLLPINGKNINFTNGSYHNGFNSNEAEKNGFFNANSNFELNDEDLINYIKLKKYFNELNYMNGNINGNINGNTNGIMNGTNGVNGFNGINGIKGNRINGNIHKNENSIKNGHFFKNGKNHNHILNYENSNLNQINTDLFNKNGITSS